MVLATRDGASLPGIQAWRYCTTAVLLLAVALYRRDTVRANSGAEWWRLPTLLIAGGGQATVATLALLSLRWVPAATTSFVFYTFPAWVALLAAVRGVEPLTTTRVAALACALAGIALMVGAPSAASVNPVGVACALVAALVYALYIPVLGQLQSERSGLEVSLAIAVGGALLFLTWALATGTLFVHIDARTFGASVLQGVLSAGGFVGFLAGLRRLGPVRTAITSTIEPFWTTMLGALVLAQPAGTGTLVGGLAIMTAVILLQRSVVSTGPLHSSIAESDNHAGRRAP